MSKIGTKDTGSGVMTKTRAIRIYNSAQWSSSPCHSRSTTGYGSNMVIIKPPKANVTPLISASVVRRCA